MGLGAQKRLCRAAVIRQKGSLECSMELGHHDRRGGGDVGGGGTHLMTSSKGVKVARVLTVEFGDSIIKGLV